MGHSQPLFLYFCLFYLITICRWNLADVGDWTADLWCQKQPLYQLSNHHCPTNYLLSRLLGAVLKPCFIQRGLKTEEEWRGEQDLDGLVCSLSKSTRPITTRSPLLRLRVTLMIYVSGEIIWQHRTETKPTWWIRWSRLPDNWSMWPPGFGLVREIFVSSRCRGKFGINSDFRSSFNEITSARKIDAPELTIDIVGALPVT